MFSWQFWEKIVPSSSFLPVLSDSFSACDNFQKAGKSGSYTPSFKMDAAQKIKAIQRSISAFSDDKIAILVVISDKFKSNCVSGHKGLSSTVASGLSVPISKFVLGYE